MESIRSSLSFNWLSVKFFTKGWDFFLKQEASVLAFLCGLMAVVDYLRGNDVTCTAIHACMIVLARRILAGGICTSTRRLDGKTVVITGCNAGIGRETARDLSGRGAKIIMACRDTKTAEKVAKEIGSQTGGELVVIKLDLASLASVRAFAQELKAKERRLHMLINNAGVMLCPYTKTEDGFEMQMGTNHLGHFLLTNLLLPLLTHSEEARIISLSSLAHTFGVIPFDDMAYEKGYDRNQAYSNSKVANILFTRHLAKKVKGTNIQVFSLHPGTVQSNLWKHFSSLFTASYAKLILKNSTEGAQTTLYCALEAEQNNHSYYFNDCAAGYASAIARNDGIAERLWRVSEKLVGL
ncbi:retinol dehydrogenase 11-like [Penaeus japonicus]|uniref:retinol dehydrogenase 11-like n=1 Tax=Penaeus japonicus TaxID=27405 RepID=UPI001C715120|nr:retinol dehydrogenase 11-like [Penaeus japonicus]